MLACPIHEAKFSLHLALLVLQGGVLWLLRPNRLNAQRYVMPDSWPRGSREADGGIDDTGNLASRLADLAASVSGGAALIEAKTVEIVTTGTTMNAVPPTTPFPAVEVKGKAGEIGSARPVE